MMHRLAQLKKSPDKRLNDVGGQALLASFESLSGTSLGDQFDPMLPWVVREWKAERIVVGDDGVLRYQTAHRTPRLPIARYTAWFHSSHPSRVGFNIMDKSSDVSAIWKRVREYEAWVKAQAHAEAEKTKMQGELVYEFSDGWSVQRIQTAEQLDWEGEQQKHCVGDGSYDNQAENELALFYSLRDPKGKPHVTLDVTPRWMRNRQEGNLARYPKTRRHGKSPDWFNAEEWEPQFEHATLNNCYGPSDSVPKPEYRARIREWMDECGPHRIRRLGGAAASDEVKTWEQVIELAGKGDAGDIDDEYGFRSRVRVRYAALLGKLGKDPLSVEAIVGDIDNAAAAITALAEIRHDDKAFSRTIWTLGQAWRYTDGPDADWSQSFRRERLEGLCELFELEEPSEEALSKAVGERALKEKKKGSLPKAWRKWAREQEKPVEDAEASPAESAAS